MWYVYIAECFDGTLYTGATTNLERRLGEHNAGKGGHYTRNHRPVRFVYQELFPTQSEALKREAEIKRRSRAQKLSLIDHSRER